jgi:hypothetical protein
MAGWQATGSHRLTLERAHGYIVMLRLSEFFADAPTGLEAADARRNY